MRKHRKSPVRPPAGRRSVADRDRDVEPRTRIKASTPGDLLGVVPYLLGFHPRESIVVVLLGDRQMVMTARMDLAALPIPSAWPSTSTTSGRPGCGQHDHRHLQQADEARERTWPWRTSSIHWSWSTQCSPTGSGGGRCCARDRAARPRVRPTTSEAPAQRGRRLRRPQRAPRSIGGRGTRGRSAGRRRSGVGDVGRLIRWRSWRHPSAAGGGSCDGWSGRPSRIRRAIERRRVCPARHAGAQPPGPRRRLGPADPGAGRGSRRTLAAGRVADAAVVVARAAVPARHVGLGVRQRRTAELLRRPGRTARPGRIPWRRCSSTSIGGLYRRATGTSCSASFVATRTCWRAERVRTRH